MDVQTREQMARGQQTYQQHATDTKTLTRIARGINTHNISIMPLHTRKLIGEQRRFAGQRWSETQKKFVRAAEVSHTRAVNRASKPRYELAPGMGNPFPKLMKI